MMLRYVLVLPPKLFFVRAFMLLFLIFHNVNAQNYDSRRLKPCELESLLRDLTYPEEGYEMHAVALRNQLRHILERDPSENYQNLDDSSEASHGPYEDKRSYRALLRDGAVFGKRNVGALARAGLLRNQPEYLKRSLATLAKNGQLPSRDTESEDTTPDGEWNEDKRNVASALKSGYMLNGKRTIASLARKYELPGKRNIQSLLRTGMLPSIAPKRNIQSLARENALAGYGSVDKRNIQTLVRDWSLPKQHNKLSEGGSSTGDNEKRNIQSLKNAQGNGRKKRSLYYDELEESSPEVLEPVFQTAPLDYEELMDAMVQTYPLYSTDNHLEEKRFLARPRSRSNFTPDPSHYDNQPAAYVDNAFMDSEAPLVGELQGYSPRGVLRRPELPRYTGEAFANHPYVHEEFSERVNPFYTDEEYRCANRLRKLLYYLKKQYYLDNKYIQATYGRNSGYFK
ncbi:neuropeptide-like 1 isoform X2 [Anopheles funestus]|uniref:Neuropeptide-like 1 n=1 Tax=Anopheles funestus TaxID=62324 RepID=A0A182R902_ANOFN|nr:neuropeptide-like 1 isoform X2 [Anopheles funestus]